MRCGTHPLTAQGKASQAEGTASAKALRQKRGEHQRQYSVPVAGRGARAAGKAEGAAGRPLLCSGYDEAMELLETRAPGSSG